VPERTGWPAALTMMWMETASGAGYERMGPKERGAWSRPSVAVTSEEPSAKVTFTAACQATEPVAAANVEAQGGRARETVGSLHRTMPGATAAWRAVKEWGGESMTEV